MLSTDQILKSLNVIAKTVDQDLAECFIESSADGLAMDLKIAPKRGDICSLELSVYPHGFDITFDNKVTESDVAHDQCDFSDVFAAVSKGNVEIRLEKHRKLILTRFVKVKLESGEGFYSTHYGIWLPRFLTTSEVIQYKPFRSHGDK